MKISSPYQIHSADLCVKDAQSAVQNKGGYLKDNRVIDLWGPENFTNPNHCTSLQIPNYSGSQQFKFIVHTMPFSFLIKKEGLFSDDANNILSSIGALSTSIVSNEKPIAYQSVGVILDVPKQNVLLASPSDLMFENNAGDLSRIERMVNIPDRDRQRWRLERMDQIKRTGLLSQEVFRHAHQMKSPDDVIKGGHPKDHNEIIIATKSGVNIHPGFPATKECRITGIFIVLGDPTSDHAHAAEWQGRSCLSREAQMDVFMQHAPAVAARLGVPVLFIEGGTSVAPTL